MAKHTNRGKLLKLVREFLSAFEAAFDTDWEYTKSELGIRPDTEAAIRHWESQGVRYEDYAKRTFLRPQLDDESEDWGSRGRLLHLHRERSVPPVMAAVWHDPCDANVLWGWLVVA